MKPLLSNLKTILDENNIQPSSHKYLFFCNNMKKYVEFNDIGSFNNFNFELNKHLQKLNYVDINIRIGMRYAICFVDENLNIKLFEPFNKNQNIKSGKLSAIINNLVWILKEFGSNDIIETMEVHLDYIVSSNLISNKDIEENFPKQYLRKLKLANV